VRVAYLTNIPLGGLASIPELIFKKAVFSKLLLVLFFFLAVRSPQTENIRSTYAREVGAATKSIIATFPYLFILGSLESQYCTLLMCYTVR